MEATGFNGLVYLPYLVISLSGLFSVYRRRYPECYLFVILIIAYALLTHWFGGNELAGFQKRLLLNLLAMLVPLNFLLASYTKTYQALPSLAIQGVALIIMQALIAYPIIIANPLGIEAYLSLDSIPYWPWQSVIGQPAQMIMWLSVLLLCLRWLFSDRLHTTWLLSIVILIIGLDHVFERGFLSICFSFSGIALVFGRRQKMA